MEKALEKFVKTILKEKYPMVSNVEVTSERDFRNQNPELKYNVFLIMPYIHREEFKDYDKIRELIYQLCKYMGIKCNGVFIP